MHYSGCARCLAFDTGLLAANNDWFQELIVLALLVSLLDGLDRIAALLSVSNAHGIQSQPRFSPNACLCPWRSIFQRLWQLDQFQFLSS